MKKHSKTTTVYRIDLEKGKYTTVSRAILMNPNLKDSAKTLLQLMLNNVESWKLRLSYYRKELNWSNDKMAAAVANLIENGYLKKDKHSKGQGKGFYYTYIISEFGNLNPNREQVEETEVLNEDTTDEELSEFVEVIPAPQPESEQVEIAAPESLEDKQAEIKEPTPQPEPNKRSIPEVLHNILSEEIKNSLDFDYLKRAGAYYINQLETKAINEENFNEEKTRKQIQESIKKSNEKVMNQIAEWIDLHNDRGTKDQRTNIKAKAMIRLKEDLLNGIPVDERAVGTRLLYLKSSVIDSNRNIDSRYND